MTIWKVPGALLCLALTACAAYTSQQQSIWDALSQGGYVLLMPHASALRSDVQQALISPERCGEQDQLSEQGRLEAQRLKQELLSHAVSVGRVLTSVDCRCIETAGIVFGRAEPWSIIDDARNDNAQMLMQKRIALREAVSRWWSDENLALVSHPDTIRSAFGIHAQPGEVLVIEPLGDAGYRLLGRLPLN